MLELIADEAMLPPVEELLAADRTLSPALYAWLPPPAKLGEGWGGGVDDRARLSTPPP